MGAGTVERTAAMATVPPPDPVYRVTVHVLHGEPHGIKPRGHCPQQDDLVEQDIRPRAAVIIGHLGHAVDELDVGYPFSKGARELRDGRIGCPGRFHDDSCPGTGGRLDDRADVAARRPGGWADSSTPVTPGRITSASVSSQPGDWPSTAIIWAPPAAGVSVMGSDAQTACWDRMNSARAGCAMVTPTAAVIFVRLHRARRTRLHRRCR